MNTNKSILLLLVWFLFVTTVSYIIPYYSNDYRYMFIEGTDEFVDSVKDVFVSQYTHYFTWGGRTPAHFIAQLLLLGGKLVSALARGLCYIVLIYLIYLHALGRFVNPLKLKFVPLLLICACLWFFLRAYAEVVFMLVSSCNYMFTTTYVLLFMLPYRFSFSGGICEEKGIFFALFMLFFGVLAGWSNENTSFALCTVTVFLCIYNLFYKKKLLLWQLTGAFGLCTGFLLLTLAPGNVQRLGCMGSNFNYIEHIHAAVVIFLLTLVLTLPLIIAYFYLFLRIKKEGLELENKHNLRGLVYIFCVGFISLGIMVFSPNFPARAATPFCVSIIICVLGVYFILAENGRKICNTRLTGVFFTAVCLLIIITASNALYGTHLLHVENYHRDRTIRALSEQGVTDPIVASYNVQPSRFIFVGDISDDSKYFANVHVAKYYMLNSVIGTCHIKKNTFLIDLSYYQDFKKTICLLH